MKLPDLIRQNIYQNTSYANYITLSQISDINSYELLTNHIKNKNYYLINFSFPSVAEKTSSF